MTTADIKFKTRVRSTGNCKNCVEKEPEGKIGYVVDQHIVSKYGNHPGRTYARFNIKWSNGTIRNQCSDCCEPVEDCDWAPGTLVRPARVECPICGGTAKLSWRGTVIEAIKDDKGWRYRVRIPDESRDKGRFIWLGCPICLTRADNPVEQSERQCTCTVIWDDMESSYMSRKKKIRHTYNMNL